MELLELKSDSQLHDAAGSQIPPLYYAAGRQISPLHFDDVAWSQFFPLHFAAGSQILPLYDAAGGVKSYCRMMQQGVNLEAVGQV